MIDPKNVPNWGQNFMRAIFFIVWIIFLGWIVASDVAGQIPQPVRVSVSQTVRVSVPDAGGNSMGSGTYLGDGLYATAWHVMRDNPTAAATVMWSDGSTFTAKLIAKDPVFDQAVLESTDRPRGGVPLASANLSIGSSVYFAGYSSGSLKPWEARVRAYASPGGNSPSDWISADGNRPSIGGDSGGPVFDETGCYVGCLWGGSAPVSTVANNYGRTQRFLLPWNARLLAWQSQGYGCHGGYCPPQQQAQMPQGAGRQVEIGGNNPTQPQGNLGWPSVPPPAQQANADDLAKQIATILVADPRFRGEKGDRGEQGLAGPQGPKGDAGEVTTEQLAAIASAVTQQLKSDPGLRGPAGKDGEPGKITDSDIDEAARRAADIIKGTYIPSTPTDADSRVLYFTSKSCTQCTRANEMIQNLKSRGAPITIISLSEKDAETNGVPMIFIPATDRKVVGLANVLSYLSTVTY
jgi:hypothetical protein